MEFHRLLDYHVVILTNGKGRWDGAIMVVKDAPHGCYIELDDRVIRRHEVCHHLELA